MHRVKVMGGALVATLAMASAWAGAASANYASPYCQPLESHQLSSWGNGTSGAGSWNDIVALAPSESSPGVVAATVSQGLSEEWIRGKVRKLASGSGTAELNCQKGETSFVLTWEFDPPEPEPGKFEIGPVIHYEEVLFNIAAGTISGKTTIDWLPSTEVNYGTFSGGIRPAGQSQGAHAGYVTLAGTQATSLSMQPPPAPAPAGATLPVGSATITAQDAPAPQGRAAGLASKAKAATAEVTLLLPPGSEPNGAYLFVQGKKGKPGKYHALPKNMVSISGDDITLKIKDNGKQDEDAEPGVVQATVIPVHIS